MTRFSKRRFLAFPKEKQHKKCAEMLRASLSQPDILAHYNEIQGWLGGTPIESLNPQPLFDRYHEHLKKGNVSLTEHNFLPEVRTRDHLTPLASPLSVSVYLDNIRSAHNIGSILRTVEAFQLGTVYFSPQTPFATHPQVIKTSMGCASAIPCQVTETLDTLPKPLIALETSPRAQSIHDFSFPEVFTIAIGNEEYGCSDQVLRQADFLLEIPLYGRKNSLNVANAFACATAVLSHQLRFR